jgi:hypothetical protein
MDNPEKMVTYGTQNDEKQTENTTQYVLDTTMRKQTPMQSCWPIQHDLIGQNNTI